MIDAEPSRKLPLVEQSDIHLVLINDLLDPSHLERWKVFAQTNPELAQEVLLEANRLRDSEKTPEQIAIDIVTFALSALENALDRSQHTQITTNVGDEGQQLSIE